MYLYNSLLEIYIKKTFDLLEKSYSKFIVACSVVTKKKIYFMVVLI